ncbi:MFS transporter [Paramaledivibacter caminithermalis]|jgi:MFS family permease|uniref:Na+/melibiose symporter n=1 Tax=Paramaledivibacter caminithermalis (strain DSM 15212 / CIP 107654 / DViRD3) TaxID=1121301 RepID=A0A1M6KIY8_PARC5|nr:MFS transporter [Paramaledivibacter caminithermalis]SHJ58917.1 Na+/melibiose symporter [Paramaledivibacter caminithermalis DSM 15212]
MAMQKKVKESSLFNKNTILILQGFFISIFGDYVFEIAISFLILKMTGSTALMSLIMVLNILPSTLLSPFAGILVDRMNKKWMMVSMDIMRGISTILLSIIFFWGHGNVILIGINAVFLSVCKPFFQLSSNCLIPQVCSKNNLVRLSSVSNLGLNISELLAKSSSGFLLSLLGAPILFLINGLTFLLSGISEIFIEFEDNLIEDENNNLFDKFKTDVTTAVNFIKGDHCYRIYIFLFMFVMFFNSISSTMTIPFFNKYYNPEIYGMISSVLVIASIISSAILSYLKKVKYTSLFIIAIIITSLARILYPFNVLEGILVLFFISGFFVSISNTIFNNILVIAIDENVRGKVLGISFQLVFVFQIIGTLVGGLLADVFDLRYIIVISNTLLIIIVMLIYLRNKYTLNLVNEKLGSDN